MGGVGSKAAVVVANNPRLQRQSILRMLIVTKRYTEGHIELLKSIIRTTFLNVEKFEKLKKMKRKNEGHSVAVAGENA